MEWRILASSQGKMSQEMMTNSGVDWWNDVLLLQQPLLNPLTLTVLALFLLTTAWLDSAALSSRGYITDDFKPAKRLTSMGNQKQLQLSAHMLWPFQFQNYLPGPMHQVLAINPIRDDPHILVDFFLKPNLCNIYVMTFPHRVIRICIFQQPVYIH